MTHQLVEAAIGTPANSPSSPPTHQRRYLPAAPIHRLIGHLRANGVSLNQQASQWSIDRRTLQRLLVRSRIRSDAADRFAVATGRHPSELWPDWFEEGAP